VTQICAAISFAHSKGVIHRDLKPSNIMLTDDWTVKVTDFGIAKIIGDKAQTRTGVAAGSLHYMAPEQIKATGVDARSDIYQMGAMLFELTTGRRPFVSDSEYELMTMHLQETPPAPSSVSDRVRPEIDGVILKALEKEPENRYQTAADLDRDFGLALRGESPVGVADQEAPTVVAMPAVQEEDRDATQVRSFDDRRAEPERPAPDERRRRRPDRPEPTPPKRMLWPWIAGAAAVVVAIIAVIFWPSGEEPSTTTPSLGAAPACTVMVAAQVPDAVDANALVRTVLRVDHPDSGVTSIDLYPTNGRAQHTLIVGPTDDLTLTVTGYDANGESLFDGSRTMSAPEGTQTGANIPLEAKAVARPPNFVINVQPFNARDRIDRVWIDGKEVSGGELFSHSVSPGRHKVRLQTGNHRLTDTVTVAASGDTEMEFFVGSSTGRLSVGASFPGDGGFGIIWIDGESTDLGTPKRFDDILEGPHEVSLRADGFRSHEQFKIVKVPAHGEARAVFQMVEN
jgi:hypothetical protein